MKHVAVTGGGGEGLPEKHPVQERRRGRRFIRAFFVFVKKENLERLKDYVLYLDFYK